MFYHNSFFRILNSAHINTIRVNPQHGLQNASMRYKGANGYVLEKEKGPMFSGASLLKQSSRVETSHQ